MKKITIIAMAAAFLMSGTAIAQESQEVTYTEDPSQGYLFNRFQDNWFITGQGGVGLYLSDDDASRDLQDRFSPAANLYVGKWFSPIIGIRGGLDFLQCKGLNKNAIAGTRYDEPIIDGKYKQKFNEIGPAVDVMINLTNWWCGYKPNRVYNAIVYGGAAGYFTFARQYSGANHQKRGDWEKNDDFAPALRAGLINQFRVSKQVALSLDLRWTGFEKNEAGYSLQSDVQAYLGVTYLFKNREWSAPVVPVCPPAENCDALRARLSAAEGRIADLEQQLRDCLNRPAEKVEAEKGPLATIYYPINVYKLTKKDIGILGAISEVMKSNPKQQYILTGYADSYTGTDQFNARLRQNRVDGVEKQLIKMGVPQSQLTAKTNSKNLCDLGEKYVALDRAVTIEEAK